MRPRAGRAPRRSPSSPVARRSSARPHPRSSSGPGGASRSAGRDSGGIGASASLRSVQRRGTPTRDRGGLPGGMRLLDPPVAAALRLGPLLICSIATGPPTTPRATQAVDLLISPPSRARERSSPQSPAPRAASGEDRTACAAGGHSTPAFPPRSPTRAAFVAHMCGMGARMWRASLLPPATRARRVAMLAARSGCVGRPGGEVARRRRPTSRRPAAVWPADFRRGDGLHAVAPATRCLVLRLRACSARERAASARFEVAGVRGRGDGARPLRGRASRPANRDPSGWRARG